MKKLSKRRRIQALLLAVLFTISSVFTALPFDGVLGYGGTKVAKADSTSSEAIDLTSTENAGDFSWDNANVYFLLTDRFKNGNTANDHSYNRGLDANGNVVTGIDERATFHGGDFAGITQVIEDGYFNDLGVNALWISAPYEQIHGYVVGDDSNNSFAHYSYHGYYVLDYTQTDANFGTAEEFQTLVDTAHEHGLRVILDIVMNHAGYNTLYDMNQYNFGTLSSGWSTYYYAHQNINNSTYHGYIDYNSSSSDWANWWGSDWIRAGVAGYTAGGSDERTMCLNNLPDFKTESTNTVGIPQLLKTKWQQEGRYDEEVAGLQTYLSEHNMQQTVRNTLTYWLSSWVREYGVDGFRCDTAKHVDLASWKTLKTACTEALQEWKAENPDKALDDKDFWMVGEVYGQNVEKNAYYTEGGFDAVINFETEGAGYLAQSNVETAYEKYASQLNTDDSFNVLSYISSHDTVLARSNTIYNGSALMLLPGDVQIYYGDETNRPEDTSAVCEGKHQLRSDMNWDSMDETNLAHWQKVGTFRNNHVAVGAGSHESINSTSGVAFTRFYNKNDVVDKVAACIGATSNTDVTMTVSSFWKNGQVLVNAYDGSSAVVTDGTVTFNSGANGTILIQEPDGKPVVSVTGNATFDDSETVILGLDGADNAKVSVDGAKKFLAVNGDTFTIGETAYAGDTVKVSVEAANEKGTVKSVFTFTKNGGKTVEKTGIIHVKSYDGTAPYVYAWSGSSTALEGSWPGTQMSEKDSEGYYTMNLGTEESYSLVLHNGSGTQSSDITGLQGEVWIDITSSAYATEIETRTDNISVLKTETREIKNMTEEYYTEDTWNALESYVEPADALIAQDYNGEEVDETAVTTMIANIQAAKQALVLVNPLVSAAAGGTTTISGTAPCESTVTVVLTQDGKTTDYTAVADDITGEWSVTVPTLVTDQLFTVKATLSYATSACVQHIVDSNDPTDPPVTDAPVTDTPVTTAPVTTAPVTTAPVTTAPVTTAPVTTAPVTTAPVTTAPVTTPPVENVVNVYYKSSWSTTNIHYKVGDGDWTTVPGVAMNSTTDSSYKVLSIDFGSASTVTCCFNNGSGTWDNNGGNNYTITKSSGVTDVTIANGSVTPGAPDLSEKLITIYYKTSWSNPYIHYKVGDGSWTTAPGVAMQASSVSGYAVATITLDSTEKIQFCFNNGNGTWDNNNSSDYVITGKGTYTVANNTITSGTPN